MIGRARSRGQRLLVLVALAAIAAIAHVEHCDWIFRQRLLAFRMAEVFERRGLLIVKEDAESDRPRYTGLIVGEGVERERAVLWGVILPLTLTATALYLVLGWRRDAVIRRGRCPDCRYDLRGDGARPRGRCPECGWRRDEKIPTAGAAAAANADDDRSPPREPSS